MHSFLNSKLLSNQQDGMTSQSFQKVMLPTSLAKDNKMGTTRELSQECSQQSCLYNHCCKRAAPKHIPVEKDNSQ